jgi:hypothetical protein
MADEYDLQRERELERERSLRWEENALTLMPLPVEMPEVWYSLLPRVSPLVSRSPQESQFYIPEQVLEEFLTMWKQRLTSRAGNIVWLRLTGPECYETIPKFVKSVDHRIRGRDQEIMDRGGITALIEHWRMHVEELRHLEDRTVIEARLRLLAALEPLMSEIAMSGAWGMAFERAQSSIFKIRPQIREWIAKHGAEYNLDEPFGGTLSDAEGFISYTLDPKRRRPKDHPPGDSSPPLITGD